MPTANGYRVAEYLIPVTVASSPVVGPWVETSGFTQCLGWLAVAAFNVLGPYLRFRIVQSVADATKTKLYLQARA